MPYIILSEKSVSKQGGKSTDLLQMSRSVSGRHRRLGLFIGYHPVTNDKIAITEEHLQKILNISCREAHIKVIVENKHRCRLIAFIFDILGWVLPHKFYKLICG